MSLFREQLQLLAESEEEVKLIGETLAGPLEITVTRLKALEILQLK